MPLSDSAALHYMKTDETGKDARPEGPLATASPGLAPETLASSLASAAASVMRWPPILACPARNSRAGLPMKADCKVPPGQLGNCVQGKIREPPRPTKRARLPASAQPGQPRAARCRVALRPADWRWEMKDKVSLASGQAPLRVGRAAAPAALVDAPALRSANPEAR